ncbi:hypothetical protein CLG96_14855 [Sphingomonas oleivorans]|uniref:TonB-dependent transporter Oar-like beta-barrel domain-containing protein n=2 Tax=Sphingomonas oleivorans TaxID=1735121 RepID=A0A2T5FV86_9SPHN|nr:hypothetical protein CLG96_14855 [Sphingomonas oleivorans]
MALAMACSASAVYAQETTSSIRGVVTAAGAPIAGATVAVTHMPSGTTSTAVTGADGAFTTSGLRPGGPFMVRVVADGQPPVEITGIQLTAGQPLRLPVDISPDDTEIVVSGKRGAKAVELSTGPLSVFGRNDIEGVASIARDVRDIARRDPFVTLDPTSRAISIAGQNGRLNKFSVDGLRFSDNVGLNQGGLPTQRGPVPLDAIEQLSVKVAPYDIAEGDFQGGAVNVVLRSGGNKFTGSAFGTYTDDKLTGDNTRGRKVNLDFDSKNYGAFLSGPIFKDKLFFALSYEWLKESQPAPSGLAGAPNVVPNLTQSQIDQISSIANSRYNYDTLGVFDALSEKDEKYTAKIDWNASDNHRASFTYIHNENSISNISNGSTSPTSPALALTSANFALVEKVDSGVVQLNSDWSDSLHSEIRGFYRSKDRRSPIYGEPGFGQFQVCLDPSSSAQQNGAANLNPVACSQGSASAPGAARLYFGTDAFRQQTHVKTKNYGADATLRWEYGDHSLKLNAAWNHMDVFNAFVPNALGTFYFDSVQDFQSGRASLLTLAGSTTGNLEDIFGKFAYDQYNIGLQDSWDITPSLNVTYGVRADLYGMSDMPALNRNFVARYNFPNITTYKGRTILQPRLGITWQATDRLTLRGGGGLFAGGTPDLLLSNSFTVPGVYNNSITIQRTAGGGCNVDAALCSAALDNVNGRSFNPLVLDYLRTNTGAIANANVNALATSYKPASTWKASFSADYDADLGPLGEGWHFGGDIYYGWVNNAPNYTDLRVVRIGATPDGRPRYSTASGPNSDFLLFNSHEGHSLVAVARFDKRWDFGLTLGGSYTFQDITDVNPVNGTTSASSYGGQAMVDPNVGAYGTSIYQIRHSWKFNLDYDQAFFGDYKTRFSLFGELRSGTPYSLTMNDPSFVNGRSSVFGVTGNSDRYLLYVPNMASMTADPLVTYDSAATFTALQGFVTGNGLRQGAIVGKNSKRSPNFFKVDLHVDQELPVPLLSGARFKLFADVENVLNLIDKDWGSLRQMNSLASVVNVACVASGNNPCAQYRYSSFRNPEVTNQARYSLWGVRVGARFEF